MVLETGDVLELMDELGIDDVDDTTDEKLELDFALDEGVPVWLLVALVFEVDGVLEVALEVEELTDDFVLDD